MAITKQSCSLTLVSVNKDEIEETSKQEKIELLMSLAVLLNSLNKLSTELDDLHCIIKNNSNL